MGVDVDGSLAIQYLASPEMYPYRSVVDFGVFMTMLRDVTINSQYTVCSCNIVPHSKV